MSLWSGFSSRRTDDFADAIRGELGEMRVPAADAQLLQRILASRRQGVRVILPTQDERATRRGLFYASAVAAAAAVLVIMTQLTREPATEPIAEGGGWFVSEYAYAQTARLNANYPSARVTRAGRLKPMMLSYVRSLRDSTGRVLSSNDRVAIVRDDVNGSPAWRLVSRPGRPGMNGTRIDSVWVSTADFRLLRHTIVESPYRTFERIVVHQSLDGQRLTGEMMAYRNGSVAAHRKFDRVLRPESGPYLADAFAIAYHTGIAMDRTWRGSVGLLGWAVRDNDVFVPANLRVEGEETVKVPAGKFDCWRIAIDYAGRHMLFWVRKADGLGVRLLDSSDTRGRTVREVVLESERSP